VFELQQTFIGAGLTQPKKWITMQRNRQNTEALLFLGADITGELIAIIWWCPDCSTPSS